VLGREAEGGGRVWGHRLVLAVRRATLAASDMLRRHAAARGMQAKPYSRRSIPGELAMIHVLAIITALPGMRDRILDAWRANVDAVRAEDGCLAYDAVIDVRDGAPGFARFGADTFVVVEKWASVEALQAHAVAPHMKAYAAKVRDWTANRAIHVLEPS